MCVTSEIVLITGPWCHLVVYGKWEMEWKPPAVHRAWTRRRNEKRMNRETQTIWETFNTHKIMYSITKSFHSRAAIAGVAVAVAAHSRSLRRRTKMISETFSIILWHPSVDVSPYHRAMPSAMYHFSAFEIVSSRATTHSVVLSERQPPEKAINTTICGVISLRAFTFNFSTVSSSVSEALVRKCRLERVSVCVVVRSQFHTILEFVFPNATHTHTGAHSDSTVIWILSVSFSALWMCVFVCADVRAHTHKGRQSVDGHGENFSLFLWWKCRKMCDVRAIEIVCCVQGQFYVSYQDLLASCLRYIATGVVGAT